MARLGRLHRAAAAGEPNPEEPDTVTDRTPTLSKWQALSEPGPLPPTEADDLEEEPSLVERPPWLRPKGE